MRRRRSSPGGDALYNQATEQLAQGDYTQAVADYEQAIAVYEENLGPDAEDVGRALHNMGNALCNIERFDEAVASHRRAIAIFEKINPDHPSIALTLNDLASDYTDQNKFDEAIPIYERTLALHERQRGLGDAYVGRLLNNLGYAYRHQGRYEDALSFYTRALAIYDKTLSPWDRDVGLVHFNLGNILPLLNRWEEGVDHLYRALAIWERTLGTSHPEYAGALDTLAVVMAANNQLDEALTYTQRALDINEKIFGKVSPHVSSTLLKMALVIERQGRFDAMMPPLQRALAIEELAGHQSTGVVRPLMTMSESRLEAGKYSEALEYSRRAAAIVATHRTQAVREKIETEEGQLTDAYADVVRATYRVSKEQVAKAKDLGLEAWLSEQRAIAGITSSALAQMSARFASGDSELARTIREQQDLEAELETLQKAMVASRSQAADQRDLAAETEAQRLIVEASNRVKDTRSKIAGKFPGYADLADPKPLDIPETQSVLATDEALLQVFVVEPTGDLPEEAFAWMVTKTDWRWERLDFLPKKVGEQSQIEETVYSLRCGLDATLWLDPSQWPEHSDSQKREKKGQSDRRARCLDLLKVAPRQETVGNSQFEVLPFDQGKSFSLYKTLLGPFADLLKGKRLLVVTNGALTSLPLSVLITETPPAPLVTRLADFRPAPWLGTQIPITVLPSVGSLKSLRTVTRKSQGAKPFLGIGNPVLRGPDETFAVIAETTRLLSTCPKQGIIGEEHAERFARPPMMISSLVTGPHADVEFIRRLPPLPETAGELCDIAEQLGAQDEDVLLADRATETTLKDLSDVGGLAKYAVVHFATHGGLAGELEGTTEPGLILTPPNSAEPEQLLRDDGYLSASEIAGLKLDADWVVLSACNTAGGKRADAEALSGLARAFFYAGARALLASHWEVGSDSAVKLTTRTFKELATRTDIGRAEAMRVAMAGLIQKGALWQAHPSQWAPFVVVGEGGR
jgi:CHAT domain-containing protein/tetratricopeptide (TPR) repeat protein